MGIMVIIATSMKSGIIVRINYTVNFIYNHTDSAQPICYKQKYCKRHIKKGKKLVKNTK